MLLSRPLRRRRGIVADARVAVSESLVFYLRLNAMLDVHATPANGSALIDDARAGPDFILLSVPFGDLAADLLIEDLRSVAPAAVTTAK